MNEGISQTLEREFESNEIVRNLHDIPPHVVYEVIVNGRRAVFKCDTGPTGNAGTEGRVIAFVREQTTGPVPEILCVGQNYFVAAWHPEAPHLDQCQGVS